MKLFFVSLSIFFIAHTQAMHEKKSESHYALTIKNPTSFYPFVSDYFFKSSKEKYAPSERYALDDFFVHLNNQTLGITIISTVPYNDCNGSDESVFVPRLKCIESKGEPTIEWDISPFEQRAALYAVQHCKKQFARKKERRARKDEEKRKHYIVLERESSLVLLGQESSPLEQSDQEHQERDDQKENPKTTQSKKSWKKRHPHCFTGLVAFSVGVISAISGWLAHSWWNERR